MLSPLNQWISTVPCPKAKLHPCLPLLKLYWYPKARHVVSLTAKYNIPKENHCHFAHILPVYLTWILKPSANNLLSMFLLPTFLLILDSFPCLCIYLYQLSFDVIILWSFPLTSIMAFPCLGHYYDGVKKCMEIP